MASATCSDFWYRGHNNTTSNAESSTTGWHAWKKLSDLNYSDYISHPTNTDAKLVCLCFKVSYGNDGNNGISKSVTLNLPCIRHTTGHPRKAKIYAKVYATDPTGGDSPIAKSAARALIPYRDACDGSVEFWNNNYGNLFNVSITINTSKIKHDSYCYVVFGTNCEEAWDSENASGPSKARGLLGLGYNSTDGKKFSGTTSYYTKGGTPSKPSIADNGNNTITITGTQGKNGTSNNISSTEVTWTFSDGTSDTYMPTASSGTSYSKNVSIPSGSGSRTVSVTTKSTYTEGDSKSNTSDTKTVYYYSDGGSPTITELSDNGNNTFKIKGKLGTNGWNNAIKSGYLYYTTDGTAPSTENYANYYWLGNTSGCDYAKNINIPSGCTKIKALVRCTFTRSATTTTGNVTTATKDANVLYHTSVGTGTVSISDNGNNSFTISGTKGANGTNNNSTGTFTWGYTNSYEQGNFTSTGSAYSLPTNSTGATVTVYAKTYTTGAWSGNTATTATDTEAIKFYKAPSDPGAPTLAASSYKNSRLTVKKDWTFTWTAATAANTSSPVKGYRIRLNINGVDQTGLVAESGSNRIFKNTTTNSKAFLDRETTSTTIVFNPLDFGIKAKDTVKVTVYAYAKNKDGDVSWTTTGTANNTTYSLWSGGGSTPASSSNYTVQNAGVVTIKTTSGWKEGVVMVKTDTGWKEADVVYVYTGTEWKESNN